MASRHGLHWYGYVYEYAFDVCAHKACHYAGLYGYYLYAKGAGD